MSLAGQAGFLILILLMGFAGCPCRADTPTPQALIKQQMRVVQSYVRQQAVRGEDLLPGTVRDTIGWLSNGWRGVDENIAAARQEFDDEFDIPDDDGDRHASPMPLAGGNHLLPFQIMSSYHHKGFLPTHDAVLMGIAWHHALIGRKLDVIARPFYGQNWHSLRHYWGGEVTLDIAQRPDGLPWGKMAMGYTGGDHAMTDHGTGIDMHGDVNLTHDVAFTSGVRQDNIAGDSTYVMLRWSASFGNR